VSRKKVREGQSKIEEKAFGCGLFYNVFDHDHSLQKETTGRSHLNMEAGMRGIGDGRNAVRNKEQRKRGNNEEKSD
jgi:hypothetical protein